MAGVIPTISFYLGTDDYKTFIENIRGWAKEPGRFSHGRPVLPHPPQDMHMSNYADLELTVKDNSNVERVLIARIRKHDLYVIGYQMDGAANFLEFKWDNKGTQYIDGSTSLGFGENYNDLGGLENLPKVGYTTLKEAIITLATSSDTRARKHALRALAVMAPEVVRFEKISEIVIPEVKKGKDTKFAEWMVKLIRSWTALSDKLLREDQFTIYFRLPRNFDGTPNDLSSDPNIAIVTSADAAERLAILKGNYPTLAAVALVAAVVNTTVNPANVEGKGLALVEVFSVRVTNIAGKNPGSLYGSVKLSDGLGTFPLYDLQRANSESIRPNDAATLTGPYRGVSGSQWFQVSLDLKNKGSSPSSDDEVSKGNFAWDICQLTNSNSYDERLTYVVSGKNGSVTVYYTPFRDAIQARVEVVLVDGGGQNPVDVQGSLVAQYSNYTYTTDEQKKYYRTVLFSKASKVNVGKTIPLSRSVVAVPTAGSLIVEANMSSANNREVAKGTAQFPPQLTGTRTEDITGKYGRVRVTVTWCPQISE